jgi:hypothetical protein
MKIAQIAPLAESVPPKLYGGTERIVSFLTEEFVRQNHDVTLFASADSQTNALLVPVCEMALRLSNPPVVDSVAHYIRLVELVHQVRDWYSGAAAYFGRMREAKRRIPAVVFDR